MDQFCFLLVERPGATRQARSEFHERLQVLARQESPRQLYVLPVLLDLRVVGHKGPGLRELCGEAVCSLVIWLLILVLRTLYHIFGEFVTTVLVGSRPRLEEI